MKKLVSIPTKEYNSKLDELIDTDIYIKATLLKRATYGEYEGEPKNGFYLGFNENAEVKVLTPVLLDDRNVYVLEDTTEEEK